MNNLSEQFEAFARQAKDLVYVSGFDPMSEAEYAALSKEELVLSFYRFPLARLFHYYPDIEVEVEGSDGKVNYSRKALADGTVHLSNPKEFNDPFECTFSVDEDALLLEAIKGCARGIGAEGVDSDDARIAAEQFATSSCSPDVCVFNQDVKQSDKFVRLPVKQFKLKAQLSAVNRGVAIDAEAVLTGAEAVVDSELDLWDHLKVFCFASSHLNPAMRAYCASGHRGFCVEYDRSEVRIETFSTLDTDLQYLLSSIYPVAYGLKRPDCTKALAECLYSKMQEETLTEVFKRSVCRKALHWGIEEERRLVLYDQDSIMDENGTVKFLRPKAVYAGALMDREEALPSLAQLCEEKGIDLYVMTTDDRTFELRPVPYTI